MSIVVSERNENEIKITLGERFDFGSVDDFRRSYENLEDVNKKKLFIDFRNTRYMDSSALGMLINIKNYLSSSDVDLKIINVNEKIKKIFSISRFDKKFDIQ